MVNSLARARKPFLYVFTGDEFLRRHKIESLLRELISPEATSLRLTNFSHLYPEDLDWTSVFTQAQTPSLMGGNLVFWISQAEDIKKGDWSTFESYCSKALPDVYFIFEADELAKAHPLAKLQANFGKHIHSGTQGPDSGFQILRNKLKQFEKTMTPGAWQILEERLGASQRLMDMALDQLVLYSEGSVIDEAQVRALASEFFQHEPFDLTEALARKDTSEAIQVFHYLYDLSGDLTSVVGLIHWQLRRIWQAKRILARGAGPDEVGRKIRVPPYRLSSFINQVRRFELETLERLIEKLWKLDWNSKRGIGEETVAMEILFAELVD